MNASPEQQPPIINVNAQNFQTEVLDASHHTPVLVDFWAEWCAPCKSLAPVLEKIVAASNGAVRLAKIDIDSNQEFAGQHGIRSIPTVRLFVDGTAVGEFMGAQPQQAIQEFLKQHLPSSSMPVESPPGPDLQQIIETLLRDEQIEQATQTLKQSTESLGDTALIRCLTARVKLAAEAAQLPAIGQLETRVTEDSTDFDARLGLSARQAANGNYDEAMEGLLLILSKNRMFSDGAARKSILMIFDALGADDERVSRFRGLLANVLN